MIFLWGIPHPHVTALAVQLFILYILVLLISRKDDISPPGRRCLGILAVLGCGSLFAINSWDALVYCPLTGLIIVWQWYHYRRNGDHSRYEGTSLAIAAATGAMVFIPFLVMMDVRGITGIALVTPETSLFSYLLVHGWYLVILYLCLIPDILRHPWLLSSAVIPAAFGFWGVAPLLPAVFYLVFRRNRSWCDLLAMYSLILLAALEIWYLQEAVDPDSRYNTVFKISLCLWPVFWIAVLGMAADRLRSRKITLNPVFCDKYFPLLITGMIGFVLVCAPIEPLFTGYTLDGAGYIEKRLPEEADIIRILNADPTAISLVEAVGDYDYYSRFSSITGIPSVIGWPSVEVQWRGDNNEIKTRVREIDTLFTHPERASDIIQKYNLSYIVDGTLEKIKYGSLLSVPSLYSPVYVGKKATLYRINSSVFNK